MRKEEKNNMGNIRRKAFLSVVGVCMAMMIAGTALAIGNTAYSASVPGWGGTTPILVGTASNAGQANISTSSSSSEPFNYALFTQGGTQITGYKTLGPGYGYTWSGVPSTNGDHYKFYVGTGLLYSSGTAYGNGWY